MRRAKGGVALSLLALGMLTNACAHTESQSLAAKASRAATATAEESKSAGRWTDLGTIVTDDEVKLSLTKSHIYALTGQTLYVRSLSPNDPWKEVETFDDELDNVFTISGPTDTIILTLSDAFETLPLRISHDGGKTFQEYGSEFSEHPDRIGADYEVPRQFFREDSGKLFASLSGLKTAQSLDNGKTWTYVISKNVGSSCEGGASRTVTLPAYPGVIFKSQDCPLQDTTVASVQTAPTEQKFEKLIDESFLGQKTANTLTASSALPNTLFIGVENGVVRYDLREKKSAWLIEAPLEQDWSGSFNQIWVDPKNANHIVLSGYPRDSRLEFLLFESRDGGKTFQSLRSPSDPNGDTTTSGSAAFNGNLVIAAQEDPTAARIWLFDLQAK